MVLNNSDLFGVQDQRNIACTLAIKVIVGVTCFMAGRYLVQRGLSYKHFVLYILKVSEILSIGISLLAIYLFVPRHRNQL